VPTKQEISKDTPIYPKSGIVGYVWMEDFGGNGLFYFIRLR